MTITATAMSAVDARLEMSTDNITWQDISGSANSVDPGSAKRKTGTANVFDGDLPVVTIGKREPMEAKISALYTDTASETWEYIRPLFDAHTKVYFRYSPKGKGATGNAVYTTSNDGSTAGPVIISDLSWPKVEAGSADPIPVEFTLFVPAFVRTVTGNSTGLGSGA
jgi:hypothetical protein